MLKGELEELAEDIRTNGLMSPVALLDGKVLDGRNRVLACALAGVEPEFYKWTGRMSPVLWVVSQNLYRRHLTISQRAALGAKLLTILHVEAKERQIAGGEKGGKTAGKSRPKSGKSNGTGLPRNRGKAKNSDRSGRSARRAAKIMKVGSRAIEEAAAAEARHSGTLDKMIAGEVELADIRKQTATEKAVADAVAPKPAPDIDVYVDRHLLPAFAKMFDPISDKRAQRLQEVIKFKDDLTSATRKELIDVLDSVIRRVQTFRDQLSDARGL